MTAPAPTQTQPQTQTQEPTPVAPLPSITVQAERLVELGVPRIAGMTPAAFRAAATDLAARVGDDRDPAEDLLLVVHPTVAPASALAPLLRLGDKPGFVVVDMADVDRFAPVEGVTLPDGPLYVVTAPARGDEMANWSPDEALPAITGTGRTPLTLTEGIAWALQVPDVIERNHCFMTIGSRLRKPTGRLDARTPALWISNGTGRDGTENRGAPKVGWCWAGNRHTWLGFASGAGRR
ncbi:hypothetical protein CLV28_1152 [Sediminihabitans luteus]|uniref:Uncharacterized protein n=1 Tax=Sediminihabitans luteus TaxID=1138585 RepID=A0A2M9D142_9CELL|nr:DUF5701 family protein [Sediminihabitans luteus]PJJ77926.1 hypothetical protein CLV28_1152 [Sediminihabitans luteus]GII99717.1 hypothetical protein Slu03_20950 [Sediminihabitans luteus]